MIAVTFALPEESKDLCRELQDKKKAGAGLAGPVLTGLVRGRQIVLCHTGVGREAARVATEKLLRQFQPVVLIASGFAGALAADLRVGDVVFDPRGGDFRAPEGLPARCFSGKITTARQTVETPADKAALRTQTGALAVDMETEGIAAACGAARVPLAGLRGISDAAEDPLPVPMAHWFDLERQRARPWGLVRYLAGHPGRIAPFAHFLSGLPRARTAMTAALLAFIEGLPAGGSEIRPLESD